MISVRDAFFEGVERTNFFLGKQGHDFTIYPKCANIIEICQELTNQDKSAKQREMKYPGVFLLRDYAENYTATWQNQITTTIQILIVTDSKSYYTADERQEKVYKPVLIPACEAILKAFERYIVSDFNSGFQKIERDMISNALYEATTQNKTQNLFNDMLDGIELRNLKLLIKKQC